MPTEEADRRSYRSALRGSVFSDEESVREISAAREDLPVLWWRRWMSDDINVKVVLKIEIVIGVLSSKSRWRGRGLRSWRRVW